MNEHKTMSGDFSNKEDLYISRIGKLKTAMNATEDGMKSILLQMSKGELTTANLKTSLANLIAMSEKGRQE